MRNISVVLVGTFLAIGAVACKPDEHRKTPMAAQKPPAAAPAGPPAAAPSRESVSYATDPGRFVKTKPAPYTLGITNPKTAQEHLNVAVDRHNKHDFQGAIAEYKKALQLRPVWALAHFRLGRAYQESGNVDAAMDEWKLAVRDDPHDYDAYAMLADAYHQKGEVKQAAEAYSHLLEYPPARMAVHYRLGFWYSDLGDKAKAREHLQSYIDLALNGQSKEPGTDRYQQAVHALRKIDQSR
jgi:tetratricopeptide (TPR) repeat protein